MIELHNSKYLLPLPEIKFTSTQVEMVVPYGWIISGVTILVISGLVIYAWLSVDNGFGDHE